MTKLIECPACRSKEVLVIDIRYQKGPQAVVRRRKCLICHHRWSMAEIPLDDYMRIRRFAPAPQKMEDGDGPR